MTLDLPVSEKISAKDEVNSKNKTDWGD